MEHELTKRQEYVLSSVIEAYAESASPIGSLALAEKSGLGVSPATVRNEMGVLEECGYLMHPHTSAGRVPTVAAYRYYRDYLLPDTTPTKREQTIVEHARGQAHAEDVPRTLARAVARYADNAVIIAFSSQDVYYTGLTYLFQKPEFSEQARVVDFSSVLDGLNEALCILFDDITGSVSILIGDEHPFGEGCSVIFQRATHPAAPYLFGILGPNRMDYAANTRLVRTICEEHRPLPQ